MGIGDGRMNKCTVFPSPDPPVSLVFLIAAGRAFWELPEGPSIRISTEAEAPELGQVT